MKTIKISLALTMLLALFGVTIAYAGSTEPNAPEVISLFTITPSTVYVGDSVTFSIDFTVATADLNTENNLCLYYYDNNYTVTFNAIGDLTSDLGDVYVQSDEDGTIGNANGNCPLAAGAYIVKWTIADPIDDAEFGDLVSFTITVPSGASTTSIRLRQRTATAQVGGANKTLTILTVGNTVYVANDTATCGTNTPCKTGVDALNWGFDNVTSPGTVIILGAYNMSSSATADLAAAKTILLTGATGASLNNAAGVCSPNAMIEVNDASANLTVTNLTIDGSCSSGNRTAGILTTDGTSNVKTGTNTIRDFTGSGNAGVEVTGGTTVVENNNFANNEAAMEQSATGTLYAFANNVNTNTGALAVVASGASNNVKCNYWSSYSIDPSLSGDFAERLGTPIVSYVEGAGALVLGNASLAAPTSGTQVLINLGRNTVNPPFNNGTTTGLGALVSDFFGACLTRNSSGPGAVTIIGDNQAPGVDGFRLYEIMDATECSPADNTSCWDYTGGVAGGVPTGTAASGDDSICSGIVGCTVVDEAASEGVFVVGNQLDPTAITLKSFSTSATQPWVPVALMAAVLALVTGGYILLRKRQTA